MDRTESLATAKLDNLMGVQPLCTGDLILVEVLQGFSLEQDFQAARGLLRALPVHSMLGEAISLKSVDNFRTLRK